MRAVRSVMILMLMVFMRSWVVGLSTVLITILRLVPVLRKSVMVLIMIVIPSSMSQMRWMPRPTIRIVTRMVLVVPR